MYKPYCLLTFVTLIKIQGVCGLLFQTLNIFAHFPNQIGSCNEQNCMYIAFFVNIKFHFIHRKQGI